MPLQSITQLNVSMKMQSPTVVQDWSAELRTPSTAVNACCESASQSTSGLGPVRDASAPPSGANPFVICAVEHAAIATNVAGRQNLTHRC
jgi:hypothetical protein